MCIRDRYLTEVQKQKSVNPTINNEKIIELFERYESFMHEVREGIHGKTPQFYVVYIYS